MDEQEIRVRKLVGLAQGLGLNLDDVSLLDQALTHASASAEANVPLPHYESLEFVGDAVLGLAVTEWLFVHSRDRTPGEYSQMRARVVNRAVLAELAEALELGSFIRLGHGEEQSGGRTRQALLADCLEAVIAAVYLDQGWETARRIVVDIFEDVLREAVRAERVWDYKSALQQACQARAHGLPEFSILREYGPDHNKQFEAEVTAFGGLRGRGKGTTKRAAEQEAAREVLRQIENID